MGALFVGILASLIVAILFEFRKYRKERFHIAARLYSSQTYCPFTDGDVGVQVSFKNRAIKSSIFVLKIVLENDGQKDIMFSSHFSEDIKIRPGNGEKIISIKTRDSRSLPSTVLSSDGLALLSWGILKVGEKIKLDIIMRCPEDETKDYDAVKSFNRLSFDIRSDCMDYIIPEREESDEEKRRTRMRSQVRFTGIVLSLLLVMAVFFSMLFSARYDLILNNEVIQDASIMYSSPLDKYIISPNEGAISYYSPQDMREGYLELSRPSQQMRWFNVVIEIAYVLFALFFLILSIIQSVAEHLRRLKRRKAHD